MELNDFVFVKLFERYNDVLYDDGKYFKVDIVYERKSIDIADAHWILTYMVSENSGLLDLGGITWIKDQVVSIDVRTDNRSVYENVKQYVFDQFRGITVDWRLNLSEMIEPDCVFVKDKSVFLKLVRANVIDDYVGKTIKCGNIIGKCVWQKGREMMLFTGNCVFILTTVANVKDLSDRMRGLYRFVADVKARVIV